MPGSFGQQSEGKIYFPAELLDGYRHVEMGTVAIQQVVSDEAGFGSESLFTVAFSGAADAERVSGLVFHEASGAEREIRV